MAVSLPFPAAAPTGAPTPGSEASLPIHVSLPTLQGSPEEQAQSLYFVARAVARALPAEIAEYRALATLGYAAAAATFDSLIQHQPHDLLILQGMLAGIIPCVRHLTPGETLCTVVHDIQPWAEEPYCATRITLQPTVPTAPSLHPDVGMMFVLHLSRVRRAPN